MLIVGAFTTLAAQSIVMCEDFEGYTPGATPPEWNSNTDEGIFIPNVFVHTTGKGLMAQLTTGGLGVTMQLPEGVPLQQHTLSFTFCIYNTGNFNLIIGSMADDTAYSSFLTMDTIPFRQTSSQTWRQATVSLSALPVDHTVIAFRLGSSSIIHNYVFAIDDIVIADFNLYDLHIVEIAGTSLALDWSQDGAPVTPWIYVSDDDGIVDSFPCHTHPVTVDNLRRGERYTFTLRNIDFPCQPYSNSVKAYIPADHGGCIDYDNFFNTGVTAYYGSYTTPYRDTAFVDHGPGSEKSRHTIHSNANERDPQTGNALLTVRPGATSSVRLGNWRTDGEAESIVYTTTVDTNNYDLIILNYAAVLQDPNHLPSAQPHFLFELLDENYTQIDPSCGAADFVASQSLGWNRHNINLWKDWTTVAFSVNAYHGRTIHVRLTTFDCSQGAHFGYAYFDIECAKSVIRVSSCSGTSQVTLSAPVGFHYRWFRQSDPATVISTQQSITVPIDGSIYLCQTTFIDRPDCSFTIAGHAVAAHNVAAIDTTVTFDSCAMQVVFHNASMLVSGAVGALDTTAYPGNARWDFGGGHTSTDTDVVVTYTQPGTHTVILTSYYADCEDADSVQIVVPVPASTHRDTVASACDSLRWRGRTLSRQTDGSQHLQVTDTFHFPNPYGCDSTLTLHLDLHPSYLIHDTTLFCYGDSLAYGGITYAADTVLPLAYTTIHGCDSLRPLLLTHRNPLPPPAMTLRNAADTFASGHPLVGCAEMALTAVDTSRVSAWRWTVGDSLHRRSEDRSGAAAEWSLGAGRWALTLVRTDSVGCTDSLHIDTLALVMPTPRAAFTIAPKRIPTLGDKTTALNTSEPDTCTWLWYNSADSAVTRDWSYRWPEVSTPSDELVTLVATLRHTLLLNDTLHTLFCTDTAADTVHILLPWLDFPSLVTPNGDGINDIWGIVGLLDEGWFPQNELWIFNQWGVLVYHVRDISSPDQFWDPNERPCPDGAYFYRFAARNKYGIVRRNGVIEVLRH